MINQEEEDDELYEHHRIVVDSGQTALRIDKFLFDKLPNVTRNKIQQGINDGFVTVNDAGVKPNYKVRPGDIISVLFPEPPREDEVIPEDIPLNVVFEDEDILVVNKPAGMVVHPAYQNWTGTLVNALVFHFQKLPEMEGNAGRPGLVHRIDKDTSGLLVIAKSERAMNSLAKQFYDHSIERTYLALVWDIPEPESGTIDVNLGRSPKDRRITMAFDDETIGRRAVTHYEVVEKLRYVSLVRCKLETGRTHQIRAHMKYIGHPLFNDPTYGGDKILKGTVFSKYRSFVDNCFKCLKGQALHAATLGFIHPRTGEKVFFEAPLPEDFVEVLERWRNYVQYT
ncbi:RluA family pseudouridine synthase [Fulvivirga sedimenti]|uniref:Pseudouridine synthase n=1 Tax=Fulvivirga sedimenti TaxID=2879465 RepID=A0A9X1KZ01_9BACT|nr:RluA family pseudouridine synthase [Fulvivirga sedimenti]MCA6078423.1 RluA family pseudouridine synthase [Fulvivirga sedimenti]